MSREKILAALRRLDDPTGRERLRGAWRAARRRPEVVLAAVVVAGVAVMVLHWS
jgi:hypothetical protein